MNRLILKISLIIILFSSVKIVSAQTDSLLNLLNDANKERRIEILQNISEEFFYTSTDSSLKYIKIAFIEATEKNKEFGNINLLIGNVFLKRKQFDSTLFYYKNALEYFEGNDEVFNIALTKNQLGSVYLFLTNYDESLSYHMDALKLFRSIEDKKGESETYIYLGNVFYQLENYKTSIDFYNSALKIYEKENDQEAISFVYNNLGEVYKQEKDFEKSLNYHYKSLEIKEKTSNKVGVANTLSNLAELYELSNDFEKAFEYNDKALRLMREINDRYGIALCLNNLGCLNFKINDFNKAKVYLNEALILAKSNNSKLLQIKIYKNLSELYEKENDFEKSHKYYKLYTNVKDSVFIEKNSYKISELKIELGNFIKEKIIKDLKEDKTNKDKRLQQQKDVIIFAFSFVIIFIILISLLYWQFILKRRANKNLSKKNESLEEAENELIALNRNLKKNEKRFRRIVQNIPVLVTAFDKNGQIVFWNKTCEKVTEFTSAEIVGNADAFKILYTDEHFFDNIKDAFKENREFVKQEIEINTKSGNKRTIIWSNLSSKVRVELSTEWIIGIDVTERNQFEKSLNREKALLNSIINSIPHPIFYKDFECRYLGANPRFYEHTGLNEETLIGKKDEDIFPKGKVSVYKNSDKVIIATKKAKRDVMWDSSYSGKDVLLDTIKVPFFDNENNIIGITGISLDITAQHLTENELIKQKEKAEEADRLKSAFLANMSHEIRSPMNAIIGFSQLIFDSFKLEDELKEYINYISQSGNNLLHLIDDIIDIAKIEAGQIKIRKEPFDLNEMLKNLYVSFQTIINKSQNTKVSIHLKIPDNNKKVFINSDEFRIKQVLSNFISNSLKFTDNGYIEFGYEILPDSKILFYTKDTGIGIPESEQKKIFERFGQVEDTYTRNYKGTGLGLAISSSIINLLGGELWLDSLPGKGSTFYIKLSVEFNESTDVENSIPLEIEINSDWHDKLILIAEDDEMNYKLLKHALEKTLVQTIRAKTGEEAIDIFKNNKRIDLILMDIQMPKLNGFEATKIIKNIDKNIPVIALTAYAMHSEKEKCEEIGFDEFISKPFNINQLLNSISEFLK